MKSAIQIRKANATWCKFTQYSIISTAVHGTDSINVTGTVKYIGGLEDDDMDIHAGLKLDEPGQCYSYWNA